MASRPPIKIKRPGDLHRRLKVPQGKKIPKAKLNRAAKAKGLLGKEARYAKNVLIPGSKRAAAKRPRKAANRRKDR